MERYEIVDAAVRAGVSIDELQRLVELGILRPDAENRLTSGDVRRVGMVASLTAAGIPLDGLGTAVRGGQVSLDFLDASAYERFSAFSGVTFAELAERTIFQDGDYYGQTVNLASRIADYARPGEVLVSQEVVAASAGSGVVFREIGPVELKGVAGAIRLHAATRPG